MMSSITSEDLVAALVPEITFEAAHFRKESDRLYLSGFEIAALIGTGVVVSFLTGLFSGIKSGVNKHAHRLGEAIVDAGVAQLGRLLDRLGNIDAQRDDEIHTEIQRVQKELDEILEMPGLEDAASDDRIEVYQLESQEVAYYLERIGYPEEGRFERAERMVVRIRKEWYFV
jgi:hypothetical protein